MGSGTLHVITNSGTTFSMAADMSGFSGTISADAIQNVRFNPSTGSAAATFDLGNNTVLLNTRNGGLTIHLGGLIGGPNTSMQGASSANSLTTYIIGEKNLNTTFAGKISEVISARTAAITKAGSGTFTLTGANTYTGGTVVNGGTLLVNNTSGSGTGSNSVTVNNGGTLGGNGIILGSVIVNNGGAISPGSNSVGQLTLKSNLTLNPGATVNFEWTTGIVPNDRLAVSNALVLNGTFNIIALTTNFNAGNYVLMTYGGSLSGSLPVIGTRPAGFACAVNTNTPGQVRLVVQVQTPPLISSVAVANGNFIASGSGGPSNSVYYLMSSTNVLSPRNQWSRIATNLFDVIGNFSFTNAIVPGQPQRFYLLQLP
jgi:fibronectin-binding autotransporter adhesin